MTLCVCYDLALAYVGWLPYILCTLQGRGLELPHGFHTYKHICIGQAVCFVSG